jgi:hypothetical protein
VTTTTEAPVAKVTILPALQALAKRVVPKPPDFGGNWQSDVLFVRPSADLITKGFEPCDGVKPSLQTDGLHGYWSSKVIPGDDSADGVQTLVYVYGTAAQAKAAYKSLAVPWIRCDAAGAVAGDAPGMSGYDKGLPKVGDEIAAAHSELSSGQPPTYNDATFMRVKNVIAALFMYNLYPNFDYGLRRQLLEAMAKRAG